MGFNSAFKGLIPGSGKRLFVETSRLALKPIHHPIQWILEVFFRLEMKWSTREAGISRLSSSEDKKAWIYTSTHRTSPPRGV